MKQNCPCSETSDQNNDVSTTSTNISSITKIYNCNCKIDGDCNIDTCPYRVPWPIVQCSWPLEEYLRRTNKNFATKIQKKKHCSYAKPFAAIDISEGVSKQKITKNSKAVATDSDTKSKDQTKEQLESMDVYYFDHGDTAYYRTTDAHPIIVMERCASRTSDIATRFWAEIFGTIHIGVTFITTFILQLFRFTLYSVIRPLTVGLIQLFSDYFIKPLLSIVFNGLIQPLLILFYNILTSVRDLCEPVAQGFGYFVTELTLLFRACRIVEINKNTNANV